MAARPGLTLPSRGARLMLLLCAACGNETSVELPAFAPDLPGTTAVVLWSRQAMPPPPALREALDALAQSLHLRRESAPAGVAAWSAAAVAVGWANLAAAPPFRDAVAGLDSDAPHLLYVDVQLLLESLPRGAEGVAAMVRERLQRALVLDGFRFLAIGVRDGDDGMHLDGTVATTGVAAGLPGLLTSVLPQARGLPLVDEDARLQVAAQYDAGILRHTVRELSGSAAGFGTNALQMLIESTVGRLMDRVVPHLGGWVTVRVAERSGELQVGLVDAAGLADTDGEWLERLASALPRGTSSAFQYELRDDRAVLWSGQQLPDSGHGEPSTGAAFFARIQLDALPGARLALSLRRRSADRVQIDALLRR